MLGSREIARQLVASNLDPCHHNYSLCSSQLGKLSSTGETIFILAKLAPNFTEQKNLFSDKEEIKLFPNKRWERKGRANPLKAFNLRIKIAPTSDLTN